MSGAPLRDAVAAVAGGGCSARELVVSSLERIEELDGELNAVVEVDPDRALADADAVDSLTERGPLAGAPVLVKDLEDARGFRTTYGSLLDADPEPAQRDSPTVAALRRAGAVIVGKANTSEYGWEGHSWNRRFGATRSPWSAGSSPGGSSGGSAAALSAGMALIATASDAGGSTRTPASQCGLLGLKPSNGLLVGDEGPGALDQSTPGLLACHPDDLRLQFDTLVTALASSDRARAGLREIRVGPRVVGHDPLDPLVARSFAAVTDSIAALADEWGLTLITDAPPCIESGQADEDPLIQFALDLRAHLGADTLARERETLDPSIVAGMPLAELSLDDYMEVRRRRLRFRAEMDAALDGALFVAPTLAIPGISPTGDPLGELAEQADGAIPQSVTNTNVHNWTGHPGLSAPAGLIPQMETPFGIQFTASRWADRVLLDVADAWRRHCPWPLTAPGYAPLWPITNG